MRGKVVLVNFYSSYCKHCAYEIGNLETFYEQHRDHGFEVIVVGVDPLEDRHRRARGRALRVTGSDGGRPGGKRLREKYPTPTAFVIDREGILRSRTRGSKTPPYFAEFVLPLLRRK
jgi:peroxiredoxin